MTAMDAEALGAFLGEHYRKPGDRLFRMEGLPLYNVPAQAAELARWRAGATEPDWSQKQPWLDTLAGEHRRGLVSRRVRRFGNTLTDDELMSCHWGYALNGRFEQIRVLRQGEHDSPAEPIDHDYWLLGDRFAVPMAYDGGGAFLGADVVSGEEVHRYLRDAERAWAAAEPFETWWSRHAELQRRTA